MLSTHDSSDQCPSTGFTRFAFHFDERSSKFLLWIDSTTLTVCKNQRIQWHKSLAAIAIRGKSSIGWFFGCKLHLMMNPSRDIVSTALSNGHTADIKIVEQLVKGMTAKLYADHGHISQELKSRLIAQGIDLITYH